MRLRLLPKRWMNVIAANSASFSAIERAHLRWRSPSAVAKARMSVVRKLASKAARAHTSRLMNVVKSFSQRDAEKLTAAKATAIIDLAGAIGGKTTPKGLLSRGTVHVPGVGAVDVHGADAAVIARAARSARAKGAKKTTHGVSLSATEKALVAHIRAALRGAKVKSADVEGIAASAATGGRFRISGYLHDVHAIGRALAHVES